MEEIDFKQLYELQDQVLEAVFSVDTICYLAGEEQKYIPKASAR